MTAESCIACWIYKGKKCEEMYLYVDREAYFERVPETLLKAMGELELVTSLELTVGRKLARADVEHVMKELGRHGFYLQMPPVKNPTND